MQNKRRQILDILKKQGSATIRNLSEELKVTGVTVRYHLEALRARGLVSRPRACHRDAPGRPQFEYVLTPKATEYFSKGFASLSNHMLQELKAQTDNDKVNAILNAVADREIADAPKWHANSSYEDYVDSVADYLNRKGYIASTESNTQGITLHTNNCPYEGVVEKNPEICQMDQSMISTLLGTVPQCVSHMATGDNSCSYLVATAEIPANNK